MKIIRHTDDDNNDMTCLRCNAIEWKNLAEDKEGIIMRSISTRGISIAPLPETQEELQNSECQLCRLWASIKPLSLDESECHLRAFPALLLDDATTVGLSQIRHPFQSHSICTLVGVADTVPSKYSDVYKVRSRGVFALCASSKSWDSYDFGPRLISPNRIDFSIFKHCINTCDKNHAQTCRTTQTKHPKGFRVIDCENKTVVRAPLRCHYTALSYVWGYALPKEKDLPDDVPLKGLSPVVQDGIDATLSLGFRYLWVDRHVGGMPYNYEFELLTRLQCIRQNDKNTMEHIARMDQIYANSQITLIAAAGESADYGLPGINDRIRSEPKSYSVQGISLIQLPRHVAAEVLKSKWFTRAWTYEECYLSKRRLIFTDQQAAFVCNEIYCAEAENKPWELLTKQSLWPFLTLIPNAEDPKSNSGGTEFVQQPLAECSVREMHQDDEEKSDALNACLGILNSFEEYNVPTYHICGVPMQFSKSNSTVQDQKIADTLVIELGWWHQYPAKRRSYFPSWSWVAWKGAAYIGGAVVVNFKDTVHIEDSQGELVPLMSVVRAHLLEYNTLRSWSAPRYIYITAPVAKLKLQTFEWSSQVENTKTRLYFAGDSNNRPNEHKRKSGLHCLLALSSDITIATCMYLDDEGPLPDELTGLVFPINDSGSNRSAQQVVLVIKPYGDCYERVGILRIGHSNKARPVLLRMSDYSFNSGPMVYFDEEMEIMDDIRLDSTYRLWLDQAEKRTIKLG